MHVAARGPGSFLLPASHTFPSQSPRTDDWPPTLALASRGESPTPSPGPKQSPDGGRLPKAQAGREGRAADPGEIQQGGQNRSQPGEFPSKLSEPRKTHCRAVTLNGGMTENSAGDSRRDSRCAPAPWRPKGGGA